MRRSGLGVVAGIGLLAGLVACSEAPGLTKPIIVSDLRGKWLLLHYGEAEIDRWELSFSGGSTSEGAAYATQGGPGCFGRYALDDLRVLFTLCDRQYSGAIQGPDKITGSYSKP